jgi:two-component system sensor histidine kinase YesM
MEEMGQTMKVMHSVRFKIVIGFVAVIATIIFSLFYYNYYAISVVREQVSMNYNNLLDQYVKNADNAMNEINLYLYQMETDSDITILYAYNSSADEYVLTKIRVLNKLLSSIGYYNKMDAFFIYNKKNNDLIMSTHGNYTEYYAKIRGQMSGLIDLKEKTPFYNWMTVKNGDAYSLVQLYQLNSDLYAGAWMNVENIEQPLMSWDLGQDGGVLLDSPLGIISSNIFSPSQFTAVKADIASLNHPNRTGAKSSLDDQYLLVSKKMGLSTITFYLALSKAHMLHKSPYFEKAIYLIPIGGIILIGLYLMLLQRIIFRPITRFIRGMRRIGQGHLDFRLDESGSAEFDLMSTTFNNMVEQIERLKIEVYEEKIKSQQAEFKHLQVQINPHFYMNTLNIIYNLIALKNYKAVQKITLHLADYFRFTIRNNNTSIMLQEELQHVRNYLEIQQLRYPNNLIYTIIIPEHYMSYVIPPLILQPFVENSIIHGFHDRSKHFELAIISRVQEEKPDADLVIVISDNGIGFSESMLQQLNNDNWMHAAGDEHLGIWNVMRRLNMYLGKEAQVTFSNNDRHGAVVTICLPKKD